MKKTEKEYAILEKIDMLLNELEEISIISSSFSHPFYISILFIIKSDVNEKRI